MIITSDRSNSHALELPDSELRAVAPSIFAESAMPGASRRYSFLSTAEIVSAMRQEGWKPYAARQSRPRTEARKGFQIHQVTFQRRDQVAAQGEYAPEVVLLNSHDRSSGVILRLNQPGLMRRGSRLIATFGPAATASANSFFVGIHGFRGHWCPLAPSV